MGHGSGGDAAHTDLVAFPVATIPDDESVGAGLGAAQSLAPVQTFELKGGIRAGSSPDRTAA